jgi:hypothetical protein
MARTMIVKKDGTTTPYFWTDKDGNDPGHKTVFKQTDSGITKMKGVSYDVEKKRIRKQ